MCTRTFSSLTTWPRGWDLFLLLALRVMAATLGSVDLSLASTRLVCKPGARYSNQNAPLAAASEHLALSALISSGQLLSLALPFPAAFLCYFSLDG